MCTMESDIVMTHNHSNIKRERNQTALQITKQTVAQQYDRVSFHTILIEVKRTIYECFD